MGRKRLDRGRMTVFAVRNRETRRSMGDSRDTAILWRTRPVLRHACNQGLERASLRMASHAAATEHIARERHGRCHQSRRNTEAAAISTISAPFRFPGGPTRCSSVICCPMPWSSRSGAYDRQRFEALARSVATSSPGAGSRPSDLPISRTPSASTTCRWSS